MNIDFAKTKSRIVALQNAAFGIIKRYIARHVVEIDLLLFIAIILFVLSKLPYLNIILEKYLISFILIISSVYIFRIQKHVILIFTFGMFVIAWGLTLAGDLKSAEQTGNLIYFLLWFNVLSYGKDIWKT